MIICSCNVISDHEIIAALEGDMATRPRTPGQVYRCLGCKPQCGRCVSSVARLMAERKDRGIAADLGASCIAVGCTACPAHVANTPQIDEAFEPWLAAAE